MDAQPAQRAGEGCHVPGHALSEIVCFAILILNAKTATGVDVLDAMAVGTQLSYQVGYAFYRCRKRSHVHDLRADVYADAGNLQMLIFSCLRVKRACFLQRDAELVLL